MATKDQPGGQRVTDLGSVLCVTPPPPHPPGSKDSSPLPIGGLQVRRGGQPTGDAAAPSAHVRQQP